LFVDSTDCDGFVDREEENGDGDELFFVSCCRWFSLSRAKDEGKRGIVGILRDFLMWSSWEDE